MRSKIKLMWLVFLGGWSVAASAQNSEQPKSPRFLIIGEQIAGSFKNIQEVLRVFIVNDSDDTLRYWGSTDCPSEFFTVNPNKYLRLASTDCRNSEIEQKIPPRRSQLMLLPLSIEQQPPDTLDIIIGIKIYPWFKSEGFKDYENTHKPQILTDKITLRFNKDGGRAYTPFDFEGNLKKTKLNLPTSELHLLSADERKLYTLSVDKSKLTETVATEYPFAGENVLRIPVTVHNNSNKTLEYCSMTCSWPEFYHVDNKYLYVQFGNCDSNIPTIVTISPHSTHTDILSVIGDKNSLNELQIFRIGLNINIGPEKGPFDKYDEELRVYNIIWSNEVQFTPK